MKATLMLGGFQSYLRRLVEGFLGRIHKIKVSLDLLIGKEGELLLIKNTSV